MRYKMNECKKELTKELKRQLLEVSNLLTPRNKNIFMLRLGLGDIGKGRTFEEIGYLYGVSKNRIREIYNKTLREIMHLYDCGNREPDYAYFYILGLYKNYNIFISV